ncbi:hypothetical protein QVD17_35799 [Tagetes erecta]|uniref:WRKY domain-containing protein n=1 Tax=Tagetes erecta TaxID=13708 RepID=A0AAD8JT60_TARER|nr:hypothetical protein QVD17_35799 [Tagetes erecta]
MEMNKQKELIETLTRGRNCAKKLQNLLHNDQKVVNDDDDGLLVFDLVTQISQSFYGGLLVLNASNSGELITCSGHDKMLSEVNSGNNKTPPVKGRRGCYKRRKSIDSREEISETIDDGYAWRKYGQKEILNSNSPRCYFRCTHKQDHGCKALKQVQKMEDGSNMFHIIYFGYHTCPPQNSALPLIDCKDFKNHHNLSNSPSTSAKNHIEPSLKQEDLCHNLSYSPSTSAKYHIEPSLKQEDLSNNVSSPSGAQSTSSALAWKEILQNEFDCFMNDGSLSDMSFDEFVFTRF